MKKILSVIIAILITLIGTVLLGLYDYNIYYNPEGANQNVYTPLYKQYVANKLLSSILDDDKDVQTEKQIKNNMLFNGEYFNAEPIYKGEKVINGKTLFKILIFKNVVKYTPDADTTDYKYRYEVYIYGVDYVELKNLFMNQSIPQDKTIIEKAGYPKLVINFYPNEDYNDEESLYYDDTSYVNIVTLNDGEEIYRSEFDGTASFTICDYGSNPSLNEDESVFTAQYLEFRGYPTNSDNLGLFNKDAYVQIDAICETSEVTYIYKDALLKDKVEKFNFNDDINLDLFEVGYNNSSDVRTVLNNVDIKGIMKYDTWIFANYIWWQCLICFVVLGLIVGGFFFALSYDYEHGKKKKSNKK